jgi:anti-sigma regulatory factor (Ser/Thr protein kinase)
MSHLAVQLSLPGTVTAVPLARETVTDTLRGWGLHDGDWLDVVALIVTELVSNAVRHAGGCAVLELHTDGRTTVTVTDHSPVRPRPREPGGRGGRGLLIVDALSARWGVRHQETAKQVWAELPPYPRGERPVRKRDTADDRGGGAVED